MEHGMDLVEVIAVDHIYVTVRDLTRSEAFYDPVMKLLGFRKGTRPIAGEPHCHYFNRRTQYTIRPAHATSPSHDPYAPGLHHLCFTVPDRESVDTAAEALASLGIEITPPRYYPEYRPDYYAVFFTDPDGIRLEIVCDTRFRALIREKWDDLAEFEDSLAKSGILDEKGGRTGG
jgi:catechol 2,3-dioxygenase-like lactoylglutathione lyase family enzyme